jgi:hypothetical protein
MATAVLPEAVGPMSRMAGGRRGGFMAANAITHGRGSSAAPAAITVDTSAEACPGCGATNPGRKMSRQQHDLIVLLIQLVIGAAVLVVAAAT